MALSIEATISIIFGIIGSIIAIAAVAQAALYFARIHHSE